MSFIDTASPDFFGLAWDESVSPPVCVIVGELGTIFYSTGREYAAGFQVYTLVQSEVKTVNSVFDVDHGDDGFVASCAGGIILSSQTGEAWDIRETGVSEALYGITHISGSIWVAVGQRGVILRTTDNGVSWTIIAASGSGNDLQAVTYGGGLVIAVGNDEIAHSSDDGLTFSLETPGYNAMLYDVVYGVDNSFFIVGDDSIILKTADGITFEVKSSPVVATFRGITYSGAGGVMVAVGEAASTVTSTLGEIWDGQDAGIADADFYDIGYGDNRFVSVGKDSLVAYSATGAGRPAFDLFQPISDIYRAQCFTQQDAYMVYGGMMEFEEGVWNYYPRRIRSPAPGTIDDFTTIGHYFSDLPGTGAILDMTSIRGGIVIAEADQLSLLTDGGSLSSPWAYQKNYGEGIKPISNLTSFNGVAFVIADDGMIYRASSVGVGRLPGFFDLTRFEDWEPGSESAWLGFDPVYQTLFVFRQKSPWTVWLVNDDTGGVAEIDLPEIVINGVPHEPRSAVIVAGLHDGIHASYAPTTGGSTEIVNVKLNISGPIVGEDELASGESTRQYGELATGSFRVTSIGLRGSCDEVLVRTWADPDSTVRPDVVVMVREETEDEWLTNDQPHGDITVFTDRVLGVGTAFSRYLEKGATTQTINATTPKLAIKAVDAEVIYQGITATVPKLTLKPVDALVNTGGQASIKATIPKLAINPVDAAVTHDPPILATIPKLALRPVDADVHRAGWYVLPWLVDQCKVYTEDAAGNRTLAPFTKTGDHSLILTTPLNAFQSLYVNPGAVRPFVLGRVGDYIFTQYGAHRISAVNTAYEVELNWYPPAECSGTYVPAQAIPEGGAEGDGKIIVGLARGFDQFMLRVLILPHEDCDATGAKITSLELGETPTGPELKTDAGG